MITFVTINTITHDLLRIIRSSNISRSESISNRQLEGWTHEYRAKLLKQDLDKGKMPNPDYIQVIQALELEEVSASEGTNLTSNPIRVFRTKLQIPKTIDLNYKPGILYVGTINGDEIQLVPEGRSKWQKYKTYTKSDPVAYLKDGYLYVDNDKELRYISIRGIFEIPTEVSHLNNPNEIVTDATENTKYPIPINMLPTLKEMILKNELGIQVSAMSDLKNDNANKVEPNVAQ